MTVIYTVGYEGTDIDRFVATLHAAGIRHVADVRAVAVSRKKGFSKKGLSSRLAAEGIRYSHFVDLGDPKPGRDAARAGLYEQFRAIYAAHLSSERASQAFDKLLDVVGDAPTCLLCFERDPATCHRSIVAEHMSVRSSLLVFNLFADDPERYVRNASRMPRHNHHQGAAAA